MIKLHILEKVMEVVNSVSKWAATMKDKHEEKKLERKLAKVEARTAKKHLLNLFKLKRRKHQEEHIEESYSTLQTNVKLMSKAKEMKQMMHSIKKDNVIYLLRYPLRNQRQDLYYRDNVVYIDFEKLKDHYNKEHYRVKLHSREPTHSSYG